MGRSFNVFVKHSQTMPFYPSNRLFQTLPGSCFDRPLVQKVPVLQSPRCLTTIEAHKKLNSKYVSFIAINLISPLFFGYQKCDLPVDMFHDLRRSQRTHVESIVSLCCVMSFSPRYQFHVVVLLTTKSERQLMSSQYCIRSFSPMYTYLLAFTSKPKISATIPAESVVSQYCEILGWGVHYIEPKEPQRYKVGTYRNGIWTRGWFISETFLARCIVVCAARFH